MSHHRPNRPPSRRTGRKPQPFAAGWHLAWLLAVTGTAAGLAAAGRLQAGPETAALAAGAAPALVGAGLALLGGGAARAICVLAWGFAAATACILAGGALGPLAPWCLAPLAAAAAFRKASLLPLGAAAAVGAAGTAVLATVLAPLPHPPAAATPWLALLGLVSVTLGAGASLVVWQGRTRREAAGQDEAERRLLELLQNQPQLLLGLYPGGRILETFGAPPIGLEGADLIGRNFSDLVAPDERPDVEAALQRAVGEGSAEIAFTPSYDPNGWCELSLRRMSSIRLVGAVRDSRAQRARERALDDARQAAEQQNAGKSRFLANMSHELRTPLNAIMGFSDIMRQRLFGPMSDRYAEYAELIHESGSHLLELINDVLDMSKIEAERFELAREDFDARDAVAGVLRLMRGQADRAGVSLRGVLPHEPLDAEADRRAVKQIALNLISNALKFTPRGGSVTVTLQAVGEMMELAVADTGVGIAPADLERLGRPFEQAGDAAQRAAGSGLGLSLVRAFARLHGGEMIIESVLGEGTTVLVRLPVLAQPRPKPVEPVTPEPANEVREASAL